MSKFKGHNTLNSLATFFRYLKGKMDARDEHAFEKHLLNDPFEADALDGFKNLAEEEIKGDLASLQSKFKSSQSESNPFISRKTIGIAASIIVILGIVSVLVFLQPDQPVLVSEQMAPQHTEEASQTYEDNDKVVIEEMTSTEKIEDVHPKIKPKKESVILNAEDDLAELDTEKKYTSKDTDEKSSKIEEDVTPMATSKKAKVRPIAVEPQYTIASARTRQSDDSGHQEMVGTLKGAEFSGGGYGEIELVTIQGKVKDRYQHPVAGANVQIKGTDHATISRSDGSYELQFPLSDTSQPVTASFIGYKPSEMIQNSQDSLNFTLDEQFFTLSEVQTISTDEEKVKQTEDFIAAEPEIGMDEYMNELLKNMQYPEQGSGKKETVVALVIISDDGDVKDIVVKRSPNNAFSIETIRLIKEGPLWKPARQNGIPVQDEVKIKLQFIPPAK